MATYLILSLVVLGLVLAVVWRRRMLYGRPFWVALAVLLLLTLVFDNTIIIAGIVDYDLSRIIGVYAWRAPIEDFAYTIAAALLMPYLWHKFGRQRSSGNNKLMRQLLLVSRPVSWPNTAFPFAAAAFCSITAASKVGAGSS